MGGIQLYPLGATGAILTEVSSKELTLKPGTIQKWMTISLAIATALLQNSHSTSSCIIDEL